MERVCWQACLSSKVLTCVATWHNGQFPDPTASGLIPSVPKIFVEETIAEVAESFTNATQSTNQFDSGSENVFR